MKIPSNSATNTASKAPIDERANFEALLDTYWSLAYNEGKFGINLGSAANEILHKLRQAAMQLRQVPQWLPIESAPQGKKVIAGYKNSLGNWRTIVACFYKKGTLEVDPDTDYDGGDEEGYAPQGWYECSESHEYILPCDEDPTHWQPLPAAPLPPNQIAASPEGKVNADQARK